MTNTIITVTNNIKHPGLKRLIDSAEKFGWEVNVIETTWRGFGTKLIETYNFLKQNPQIESFVFVDAHDVVVLSDPKFFNAVLNWNNYENKMLVSCEKACWPDSSLADKYSEYWSEWKYVNSGLYYAPSDIFIKVFESSPPEYHDDDQLWLTNRFLNQSGDDIKTDTHCMLFQSYSHIREGDFGYENNRLQNLKTLTQPIFIHGNGATDMTLINQLL
jgi:hypothetical protein